ncbi:MAG: hypothetical protein ACRCUT_14390, partial [Spirochaetota bacterium]
MERNEEPCRRSRSGDRHACGGGKPGKGRKRGKNETRPKNFKVQDLNAASNKATTILTLGDKRTPRSPRIKHKAPDKTDLPFKKEKICF